MLSDSTFVHLLSYLSQDIEGVIGVFLTQNQRLQVVSYGIFHKPRIVELCLDFILLIVREVFVVKHIYIYLKMFDAKPGLFKIFYKIVDVLWF